MELSEFDIKFTPKAVLKGQVVADFVAEFTKSDIGVRRMMQEREFQWKLHVDSSSNTQGSKAWLIVSTLERHAVECAMRFDFKATNNQI